MANDGKIEDCIWDEWFVTSMHRHERKFDPERMGYLESDERRRLLDPERVIGTLSIPNGAVAADVGCGPGVFTIPLARLVGMDGRVYAVDTEPQMIRRVEERLAEEGIRNVTALQSSENRIPLPDSSMDFVLLVTVLHELEGLGTLSEIRRILSNTGTLLVVDWKKKDEAYGPPMKHRLSTEEAAFLLFKAGFAPGDALEMSGSHYGFKAKKH